VKYGFRYDSEGRLLSITDANNDSTVISRDGTTGVPTTITAPYGQTTVLGMDTSEKYLASIQDPAGQTHTLTYYSGADDGLLHTSTNPRSKTWTYTYSSADGRLSREDDPANGYNTLSQTESGASRTVTRTTGEGRVTKYTVMQMLDGLRRRFIDHPNGSKYSSVDSMSLSAPYGEVIRSVGTAGDTTTTRPSRDYRFGWLAPVDSVIGIGLPSGLRDTVTNTRSLSGSMRFESSAFNGRRFLASYDTSQRVLTLRTPVGRTSSVSFDPAGRVTTSQGGSLAAVEFGYDSRGKLTHLLQGSRGWRYAYDTGGRLTSVTDTLDRVTTFAYDQANRDTMETLPDGREVHFDYDEAGNLTRLTPPGGVPHTFAYTPVDLNNTYAPPSVPGISDPATTYEFNHDRQLTRITRPDTVVTLDYGSSTGQLATIHHSQGSTRACTRFCVST